MVNIRPLSRSLQQKAVFELNEDPNLIEHELIELKNRIFQLPYLKSRLDDQFLIAFLRNCKHNVKEALKKIEKFYACRCALPELMENRDPLDPRVLEILRLGVGLPLPYTTAADSPRVILIRVGSYNASQYSMIDIMKIANMISDVLLYEDDNSIVAGEIAIVDFKNVTKSHLLQLDPMLMKKLSTFNQEGSPIQTVGIHYVHTPPGFDIVFSYFRNMFRRLYPQQENEVEVAIHPTTRDLRDHIGPDILPLEYEGHSGPLESIVQFWEDKLMKHRDYFLADCFYGIDDETAKAATSGSSRSGPSNITYEVV